MRYFNILNQIDAPSHVVLTTDMADFSRITEPHINLVACFLEPNQAFNQFALSMNRHRMSQVASFQKPQSAANDNIEQKMLNYYKAISENRPVLDIFHRFLESYRETIKPSQLWVRQFGSTGNYNNTMKPHIDPKGTVRGLADFSSLGMLFFDQTGWNETEAQTYSHFCHGKNGSVDKSVSDAFYAVNQERICIAEGPVLLMFKGAGMSNPLLHAAIPLETMRDQQRKMRFRPTFRIDDYT